MNKLDLNAPPTMIYKKHFEFQASLSLSQKQ